MKEFLEIVFSKYKDPKIAMWMKNVLVLIMLLNFCAGLLYPMEQKKTVLPMFLPMFLSMILLLSVNCALSRGKDYTWLDTVTFLLLIVFMITMPLMEYGTSVNPPEMNADKLPETDFKSVTLTKQGTIVFDRETVTKDELVELLKQLRERSPKTTVLLRADGERSYNDVIELLTFIKNSGFREITLVTQAEGK